MVKKLIMSALVGVWALVLVTSPALGAGTAATCDAIGSATFTQGTLLAGPGSTDFSFGATGACQYDGRPVISGMTGEGTFAFQACNSGIMELDAKVPGLGWRSFRASVAMGNGWLTVGQGALTESVGLIHFVPSGSGVLDPQSGAASCGTSFTLSLEFSTD